jgi:hypothetical protein
MGKTEQRIEMTEQGDEGTLTFLSLLLVGLHSPTHINLHLYHPNAI